MLVVAVVALRDRTGPALLIFLRKPELGKVKTRLAASVGDERALSVYRRLTAHTFRIAASFPGSRQAWYANEPDGSEVAPGCSIHQQCEGDLGERMLHALESTASQMVIPHCSSLERTARAFLLESFKKR